MYAKKKFQFAQLIIIIVNNHRNHFYGIFLILYSFLVPSGAIHLSGPIAKVSKGLCKLALAHCGLTSKGVNQMSHSLSLNQSISNSLTFLDLSGNSLKDDITVSLKHDILIRNCF